ncbi:MAG: hypothetical protein M1819_004340 [Sarea resinae]|nr:MAG: hypothetical protein M1819_004340 [Sarea resinae]
MTAAVDYAALREQTLGSTLDEEAVTVNTRALIDKVLARYSGEWTVLRELLQNAADASASSVIIKFETLPSPDVPVPHTTDKASSVKHVLLHHTLKRLLVRNNGQPFGANDWSRLKRIAEGNPDETKIGAFGVGFYSVFADCEEPFVSSGKEAMAFYWKGNSLFTRRLQLSDDHGSSETCFVLDYRNTSAPVPALLPLCQFLATSLTFVGLETIELWVDDWKVLAVSKKAAPSVPVPLPKDVDTKTKENVMKVMSVDRQNAQLDAKWMNIVGWKPSSDFYTNSGAREIGPGAVSAPSLRSFFSRLTAGPPHSQTAAKRAAREDEAAAQKAIFEDLAGISEATVFLGISTASLRTSVSASFAEELERATKKPPPKTTKLAILTSSHDESSASLASASGSAARKAVDIFASVLPTKAGKIFIGFPTAQTTGLLAHISAPSVIPTVERESIDLNARMVKTWNYEMLRAAGIVCRIAWSGEMNEIRDKISRAVKASGRSKVAKEDVMSVLNAAIHTLKQFTFQDSTPSSLVGQTIEEAFWTCNKKASLDILSTRGVLPSYEVRIATEDLSFVEGIPVLPEELMNGANEFVRKLKDFGLISEITIWDIQKELETKALSADQLGEFLRWISRKAVIGDVDGAAVKILLDVAVATIEEETVGSKQGGLLVLAEVKHFINPSKLLAEGPVPPNTVPYRFIKNMSRLDLEALGWEELQVVPWLRWLIENSGGRGCLTAEQDITASASFAAQILPVISKQWDALSQSSKGTVTELLSSRTVIPTKLGMRKPPEAYFPSVKLFDDLPVVIGLQGVKEKFLVALGVRKTVELGVVFERLMAAPVTPNSKADGKPGPKWSHIDLIRYLASVRDDIPSGDIKRLKETPICPAEDGQNNGMHKVSELFEPKDQLRSLGLPIINWPGIYSSSSIEGKFLTFLGLRSFPTVPELVDIMAKSVAQKDFAKREAAFNYFVANHHINGYIRFDVSSVKVPFLPVQGEDASKPYLPTQCFTNDRAAILGFKVLRRDLHPHASKFGVTPDPPMQDCIVKLIKDPPKTRRETRDMFGYFSARLGEMGPNSVERLKNAEIVPIFPKSDTANVPAEKHSSVRYVPPRLCFLGDNQMYGDIFDFVDFGQEANTFLLKCGSKHEPSRIELAQMVVREPNRTLATFQSYEKYLDVLRILASELPVLKKDKTLYKDMKSARFLLAYKIIPPQPLVGEKTQALVPDGDDLDEDEEIGEGIKDWSLVNVNEAVIVDDFISYSLFKTKLLVAPQEELLESFYSGLGVSQLSFIVEEDYRIGTIISDQRPAAKLQKQVLERSRLFLHDQGSEKIRHDARWLEKHLSVQTVRAISLRRNLRGHNVSDTEARTAAVTQDPRRGWVLWVTSKYDLFQVSQVLVTLLLLRPRPHSTMMLEMLLGTDLLKLRTRGYNVDRILRAKEAEARVAEDRRLKQLEEDRKRIREQEEAWKRAENSLSHEKRPSTQEKDAPMPGAFGPDSPDHHGLGADNQIVPNSNPGSRRAKGGLFSSLTRHLGFDDGAQNQLFHNLLGNGSSTDAGRSAHDGDVPPPPYTEDGRSTPHQPGQPESVTAPHQLSQNLVSAIQASRSHDSSNLYSPPAENTVKETASYCDERPGQDIFFLSTSSPGIKIFVAHSVVDKSAFLTTHSTALNAFASILLDCAGVFALPPQSIHIFYDESGSTIAFNRQGSLFCNFRFFEQLHLPGLKEHERPKRVQSASEATIYWWVVLCHELAHNLVGDHSAAHSFYT